MNDLMPYLSKADREVLLGGMCNECWNEFWKDDSNTTENTGK